MGNTVTGLLARERIGGAATTGFAVRLVRAWVGFYTGWVSAPAAERRRDEIHSDLWEQQAYAREIGTPPIAVSFSIARRAASGIPADLLWVHTERAALRSLPAEPKATIMNSVLRFSSRWWWVLGAAVLSAIILSMGIGQLLEPGMPYLEGSVQAIIVGGMLAAGVILKARMPRTAAALIVAGAATPACLWWAPIVMTIGIAVLLGSMIDLVRRFAQGDVLLGALAAVGALGVGAALVGYVWVGFDAGVTGLLWFAAAFAGVATLLAVAKARPAAPPQVAAA
ncbi:hypothetical protein MK786_06875 [Microbacterium sp. CFH 31415]|uniref:hypothetical protein n=1 Tax=Microbacterium sp. CFH 31415 TaxID=2921732 RepID=UPI001F138101|nr:hypothetical protein [Microbacterium sp. CFH 31415]MCH6230458.1 hypothetical protein [Microbacterium sp. CFH 31415]